MQSNRINELLEELQNPKRESDRTLIMEKIVIEYMGGKREK